MTFICGIEDKLGWTAPKKCGEVNCLNIAEQGWGRCKKHLEQPISRIVILDDERAIIKGEDV